MATLNLFYTIIEKRLKIELFEGNLSFTCKGMPLTCKEGYLH
jgi:hypothetical protein